MSQDRNSNFTCDCCLNDRKMLVKEPSIHLMPLIKDKYTLDDGVVFAKIIKGIQSYELVETMTYYQAVEHYAGNKENATLYFNASMTLSDQLNSRQPHSLVIDFMFRDMLDITKHCQACSLSLTKKICNSNIYNTETLEIALTEFVTSVLLRNKRDRYKTLNKETKE